MLNIEEIYQVNSTLNKIQNNEANVLLTNTRIFSVTETIQNLKNSQDPLCFVFRYYETIIKHLCSEKSHLDKYYLKYKKVFDHFDIKEQKNKNSQNNSTLYDEYFLVEVNNKESSEQQKTINYLQSEFNAIGVSSFREPYVKELYVPIKFLIQVLEKNKTNPTFSWSKVSKSTTIIWSIILIEKFHNYFDWKELSGNESLPWSELFIEKYYNHLDWEQLSGNKSLPWSELFIEKYYQKWTWISKHNFYFSEFLPSPSISTNENIKWTNRLINKYSDKIDFWRLFEYGDLSKVNLIEYENKLDKSECIGSQHFKYSDYRESVDVYKTGWEILLKKCSIRIPLNQLDYFYQKNINVFSITGNPAKDGFVGYDKIRLLNLFNNCIITDIHLEVIIQNEFNWAKLLMSNNHIWNTIFKSLFNNEVIESLYEYVIKYSFLKRKYKLDKIEITIENCTENELHICIKKIIGYRSETKYILPMVDKSHMFKCYYNGDILIRPNLGTNENPSQSITIENSKNYKGVYQLVK